MEDYARKLMMGHKITDVTDKHYAHLDLAKYLSEEIRKKERRMSYLPMRLSFWCTSCGVLIMY